MYRFLFFVREWSWSSAALPWEEDLHSCLDARCLAFSTVSVPTILSAWESRHWCCWSWHSWHVIYPHEAQPVSTLSSLCATLRRSAPASISWLFTIFASPELFHHKQILRKSPLRINPLPLASKSCPLRHPHNFSGSVFVRAFCPNRFIFFECESQLRRRNFHILFLQGAQVHLNSLIFVVPTRLMPKTRQIKIGAQFAIDSRQQV